MKINRHRNLLLIVAAVIFGNLFILTQPHTFAQSPDLNKQKSDAVEITPQFNSPLIITLTGVDNSEDRLIKLKFTAQNSGAKKN